MNRPHYPYQSPLLERGGGCDERITERRPPGWRPGCGSPRRVTGSTKSNQRRRRDAQIQAKLDRVLGPVEECE